MTFSHFRTTIAAAMLGVSLTLLTTASAEEPGVVRISDGIRRMSAQTEGNAPPIPLPADVTGEGTVMESNGCDINYAPGNDGCYSYGCNNDCYRHHGCLFDHSCLLGHNNCHNQRCPHGNNCPYGNNCPHRGHGNSPPCCWGKNALPPDYGFYPPTPYPYIWRQPVVYNRYLPDQLYGTPGMRYTDAAQPMVYMPTDTTQLGFNYMHVPQWMPNRANYPLAPNPPAWQRRVAPWPKWEDPYRAEHKSYHFGRNEYDLMITAPQSLPYQPSDDDDDDDKEMIRRVIPTPVPSPTPAPAIEASLETDAQI